MGCPGQIGVKKAFFLYNWQFFFVIFAVWNWMGIFFCTRFDPQSGPASRGFSQQHFSRNPSGESTSTTLDRTRSPGGKKTTMTSVTMTPREGGSWQKTTEVTQCQRRRHNLHNDQVPLGCQSGRGVVMPGFPNKSDGLVLEEWKTSSPPPGSEKSGRTPKRPTSPAASEPTPGEGVVTRRPGPDEPSPVVVARQHARQWAAQLPVLSPGLAVKTTPHGWSVWGSTVLGCGVGSCHHHPFPFFSGWGRYLFRFIIYYYL